MIKKQLRLTQKEIIRARKILGRSKQLGKYPPNSIVQRWWVDLDDKYSAKLEIRNDADRPRLYFGLASNKVNRVQDIIYDLPDDANSFDGLFQLFGENDEEYEIEISAQ